MGYYIDLKKISIEELENSTLSLKKEDRERRRITNSTKK